jgi:hypothetical protein
VIEFTPDGTVKLCAAPVNEKSQVTVLAASEQPGGNAAAAGPGSVNDPRLAKPTVATDSHALAPRTRDNRPPPDSAALKVMPLPLTPSPSASNALAHDKRGWNRNAQGLPAGAFARSCRR